MGQYKSQYTGPQIDAGINAALNPDVAVTPDSDALVTSGAVADALDNIDPTITSDTDTTLNGILVGNGSKVGTKSLDTSSLTNDADHVPVSSVVKSALTQVESDLASIHATGTTNTTGAAIAEGTYFYLNAALVKAKADIAVNATFTNGTNYEPVTAGGLNDAKSKKKVLWTGSVEGGSSTNINLNDDIRNYDYLICTCGISGNAAHPFTTVIDVAMWNTSQYAYYYGTTAFESPTTYCSCAFKMEYGYQQLRFLSYSANWGKAKILRIVGVKL